MTIVHSLEGPPTRVWNPCTRWWRGPPDVLVPSPLRPLPPQRQRGLAGGPERMRPVDGHPTKPTAPPPAGAHPPLQAVTHPLGAHTLLRPETPASFPKTRARPQAPRPPRSEAAPQPDGVPPPLLLSSVPSRPAVRTRPTHRQLTASSRSIATQRLPTPSGPVTRAASATSGRKRRERRSGRKPRPWL